MVTIPAHVAAFSSARGCRDQRISPTRSPARASPRPGQGRPDRHRGRRRVHRRVADPLLRRAGLHQHPGDRPQAPPRLVPARPGRRVDLHGPQPRAERDRRRQGRRRGLQPRGRHGRHGLHRELPRRVPAQHPRQHAPDRGVLPRRRLALLLLLLGLRLQHGPPEVARGHRPQGVRRLPGDGRARLRLGEADLRDVLRGVLGGARPRDPHRPLPQHLRPQRHLVRRPREGAGGDVPQGARGPGQRRHADRDLGRRHPDALVLLHRRLRPRHRPDHAQRRS